MFAGRAFSRSGNVRDAQQRATDPVPAARRKCENPVWGAGVRRRLGLHVLSLALYSGFALLLFRPVLSQPATTYIGGEPGPAAPDPVSFMWFLTWTPYALTHHLNPLLTNWIFADSGANLAWNTATAFIAVVVAPITWTAGPILAYNVAMISSLTTSAWTACYAADRVFRSGFLPALLAGAVYGFSPFTTAHAVGQLHLTAAFTPPLFLIVLHDILITQQRPSWVSGVKLAVLTLIQYFVSAEVLLAVGIFASIGVCILMVSCRHAATVGRVRHAVESLAVAILIVLPLLAYPLYLTFFGPWRPTSPVWGSGGAVASLLSFVVPSGGQAILGPFLTPLRSYGGEWCNTYLGIPLIALLVFIGYTKRGERPIQFLLALAAAVTILSTGPSLQGVAGSSTGIPMPWRLFELVPLFANIITDRFGEYLYLLVGLILALYIADASACRRKRIERVTVTLLAVAFLVPPVPLLPATLAVVPDFFRLPRDTGRVESPALVVPFTSVIYPYAGPDRGTAMLWQAESRMAFKMPEGYAFGPGSVWPAWTPLSRALIELRRTGHTRPVTPTFKAEVIATLKKQRIKTILVGPSQYERESLAFLARILDSAPDPVDGIFVWWHIDRRISIQAGPPDLSLSTSAPKR